MRDCNFIFICALGVAGSCIMWPQSTQTYYFSVYRVLSSICSPTFSFAHSSTNLQLIKRNFWDLNLCFSAGLLKINPQTEHNKMKNHHHHQKTISNHKIRFSILKMSKRKESLCSSLDQTVEAKTNRLTDSLEL